MKTTPNTETELSIAAVERDTGLSKDTLRVWERRYGFPTPKRDSNGERLYPQHQVDKLRLIRRLLDTGHRPSRIISATPEELGALLDAQRNKASSPEQQVREQALLQYVRLHRSSELVSGLHQALMKQGLQRFVLETIAPLNEAVGEGWMRGEIDVPEEHLYTEQVQNVLRSAIGANAVSGGHPRVLLTTFPDEHHILGLLMAEATLVPEGASCVSLGTRTPLADIRGAAVGGNFDIVGLSFSIAYPARQAIEGLIELRAALPEHITIWAGGAAVKGKQRRLPGIRVINGLTDTVAALHEWRAAHPG
ncbi:MAG: MerR family transcriptional regulator [Azoarcus sp.]|jgi:DNA-binding transcriptional MerR regulator/methylmalonyl-CoA mutase cobalamin-binding subunit|uniref:MerR family transcriptional regulator n=1 Tax=Parazoarcus communis TaxID=41977 RepID=A0A2U8GUA0_9RHOO|nr:MerR family transcriptional regulator [Parazoarcus communis]AWI76025.1 MerR family transcriptional regulator [Parazoarcus communis]PLX77362.1 MAG: MerR family transcriptional regulator [Azoarcus sp.]TVT57438.1 MAG: MerR family transcriptional regulator [Azoarcus sp. PHD]|tara:strand:+ start:112620 stop:113540 length:921 start_codon:yes stop_codon:yes gene_type:complete